MSVSRDLPLTLVFCLIMGTSVCLPASATPTTSASVTPDRVAPDSTFEAAIASIDSLRDQGAYRDAFARLVTLRDQHPGNARVLYRLALTRVDMGEQAESESSRTSNYRQAGEIAREAVEADSTSANAHLTLSIALGRVALTSGTRERIQLSREVKSHADRAVELDSTLAGAYHVRGRWNREVADLGFFERTIVKTVYGGLPEASFEQAVRDFQKALEIEDEIVHRLELARTYLKMGRESDARTHLERVLAMTPSDPDDPRHKKKAQELLDELG